MWAQQVAGPHVRDPKAGAFTSLKLHPVGLYLCQGRRGGGRYRLGGGGRLGVGGDFRQDEDGVGVPKGAGAPERAADAHGEGGSERIESV